MPEDLGEVEGIEEAARRGRREFKNALTFISDAEAVLTARVRDVLLQMYVTHQSDLLRAVDRRVDELRPKATGKPGHGGATP